MQAEDLIPYVQSAARLNGLALDEACVAAVAQHLARSAAIAATLEGAPLAPHDELAEIYRPAPFPMEDA